MSQVHTNGCGLGLDCSIRVSLAMGEVMPKGAIRSRKKVLSSAYKASIKYNVNKDQLIKMSGVNDNLLEKTKDIVQIPLGLD